MLHYSVLCTATYPVSHSTLWCVWLLISVNGLSWRFFILVGIYSVFVMPAGPFSHLGSLCSLLSLSETTWDPGSLLVVCLWIFQSILVFTFVRFFPPGLLWGRYSCRFLCRSGVLSSVSWFYRLHMDTKDIACLKRGAENVLVFFFMALL